MTDQTIDPRIAAYFASAKARAAELERWDADHAIYDLLAAEIPRDEYNAAAHYCAHGCFASLRAAWGALGGRGEYAAWVMDLVSDLGTWVTWNLGDGPKYGLSDRGRWTPPTKPLTRAEKAARKPGLWCGKPGHGSCNVLVDPRGPDYRTDPKTAVDVCETCFLDWCDEQDDALAHRARSAAA